MSKKPEHVYAELGAFIFVGAALLTLLSLGTYDPNDVAVNSAEGNKQYSNAIGFLGAYWSVGLFFLFGLAAYFVPLLFLSASAGLFLQRDLPWPWKILWAAVLLISAAGLLDLQHVIGSVWRLKINLGGAGGFIGESLNQIVLIRLLGTTGTGIVLTSLYIAALIFVYELRPIAMLMEAYRWFVAWRERREEEKLVNSGPSGHLAAAELKLSRERREIEKQLAQQTAALADTKKSSVSPPPQVIDTSLPAQAKKGKEVVAPVTKPLFPAPPAKWEKPERGLISETPKPVKVVDGNSPLKAARPVAGVEPDYANYKLPDLDLLQVVNHAARPVTNEKELRENSNLLVATLATFGIECTPGTITKGATITRYELYPASGVRVDKIVSLQRDIARAMKAEKINILAPIPGKDSVGVEIPNVAKVPVVLRDLFETPEWTASKARIPLALGKDVYGQTLVADLADMPHLLIAGTTGSGKSVCINCILLSLLYRFNPQDLRLILVDPKQVEMQIYNTIPHLVVPVVVDPKKVLMALRWVINEMEKRYKILAQEGVRNIAAFNARTKKPKPEQLDLSDELIAQAEAEPPAPAPRPPREEVEIPDKLPYIVVIIDELADLMQTAPADVESAVARLTAKARAAGIHLIVATQTPRREVVTGVIKTNIPCRIAFQVPSALDSRVILDESGAENLLGKGDMLYLPPGSGKFTRGQGAFVSDDEVRSVVDFCSGQTPARFDSEIHQKLNRSAGDAGETEEDDKELIVKCLEVLRQEKRASTSLLQRRLRLGYNRAAWVMDFFERRGIIGPDNGAKPRDILIDLDTVENYEELLGF